MHVVEANHHDYDNFFSGIKRVTLCDVHEPPCAVVKVSVQARQIVMMRVVFTHYLGHNEVAISCGGHLYF